jgi:hypothetical protein
MSFPLALRRDANKQFRWHVCDFSMVCVNIPISLQIFLRKGGFYDEFGRNQSQIGGCQPKEGG